MHSKCIQRFMFRFAICQLPLLMAAFIVVCACSPLDAPAQIPGAPIVQAEPQGRIVPPAANYQFPNGQKFIYAVEWHMFNAGTATMRFDRDGAEEKLSATATTAGTVNFIYPVHSWFNARIESKTFCSTYVFKHEEGKRKREIQIRADPARGKSVFDEKNLKTGEARHQEDDAPACATDILSGFFYIGSRPLSPGSEENLPVVDGGKPTVVRARVEGREEIQVPAGDFSAVRVLLDPMSGKFEGKGQIWVWYSDDAAHTPLQMKTKLQWGTVMFRLLRIER
jgi:hypothetical protein